MIKIAGIDVEVAVAEVDEVLTEAGRAKAEVTQELEAIISQSQAGIFGGQMRGGLVAGILVGAELCRRTLLSKAALMMQHPVGEDVAMSVAWEAREREVERLREVIQAAATYFGTCECGLESCSNCGSKSVPAMLRAALDPQAEEGEGR